MTATEKYWLEILNRPDKPEIYVPDIPRADDVENCNALCSLWIKCKARCVQRHTNGMTIREVQS